jgi:hypothetical protein
MAEAKSKQGFKPYQKKDTRDFREEKEKTSVRKLYLSKSGETNFHLWKEDMQLKIAIDYPLFANVFEHAKHASFDTLSLEEFINRAKTSEDSEEDSEEDNSDTDEAERDEQTESDTESEEDEQDTVVLTNEPKTAGKSVKVAESSVKTAGPPFAARVRRHKKETDEEFEARCVADVRAQEQEYDAHIAAAKVREEEKQRMKEERQKAAAEQQKRQLEAQMVLYGNYLKKTLENEMEYTKCYVSVFAYILQSLCRESVDLIMLHKRWGSANAKKDPLKLFILIKKVHLGSNAGYV